MTEETNDMISPENKLPESLERHLRQLMPDRELDSFREQLPSEFLADASEGLDHLKDSKELETALQQLNQQMHYHLLHKKSQKRRLSFEDLSVSFWAILIVILLIFAGFFIIRMLLQH
jgi:hypothetical protein